MVTATISRSLEEKYDKLRQHIKKQRHFCQQRPASQSYGFSSSNMDVSWDYRERSTEEWMLLNCGVEDSCKSLGLQDQTSQS